jgi:hypothetical protein
MLNLRRRQRGSSVEFQYIFFAIFAAIVAYWLYQVSTKGFKGAFFGGAIERTVGEITLARRGILSGRLRVHRVAADHGHKVGLEIVYRTPLSYQMIPVTLSTDEARRLGEMLKQAIGA